MRILFTTFSAALILGCGSSTPAPKAPDSEAGKASPVDITGRWQSDCIASPQADGSTQHINLDFLIKEDTWGIDYTVYGDPACTAKLVTVHIEGPYEIGEPSTAVKGAYNGKFGFTTKTITPHVEPLVGMLNSQPGCGPGNWKLGVTQDVYQTGCPGFGQYSADQCSADYDLVYVSGDTLQFGKRPADNNMCTEDRRPTELNPVKFARR